MSFESLMLKSADATALHVRYSRLNAAGPTCLLIHGSGEGGYVWNMTCAALEELCSLVVVDLCGHGDSERSPTGRYTLQNYIADVASIITSLALRQVVLIGHSIGGHIAIHLAAMFPAPVVCAVVLVDFSVEFSPHGMRRVAENLTQSLRTYRSQQDYEQWLMKLRPWMSAAGARDLGAGALRSGRGGYELKVDPRVLECIESTILAVDRVQLSAALQSLSVPTLLVRGAGSAMVSAEAAARTVTLLPHGRLTTVPEAGHAVMSDNPEGFSACIVEFLRTCSSRDAVMKFASVNEARLRRDPGEDGPARGPAPGPC